MSQGLICFLDFDGVLHPISANNDYFRQENIISLFNCISEYEISIVISSTWRLDLSLDEIVSKIEPLGSKVVGITPEIDDPFIHFLRQHEVELYLSEYQQDCVPWFAIDDTPAFYKSDAPVLLIDGKVGFSENDCPRLKQLINTLI